jgi:hypothetical protein
MNESTDSFWLVCRCLLVTSRCAFFLSLSPCKSPVVRDCRLRGKTKRKLAFVTRFDTIDTIIRNYFFIYQIKGEIAIAARKEFRLAVPAKARPEKKAKKIDAKYKLRIKSLSRSRLER